MNFKRKRTKRSVKTYKEWYSDCDQYRISWRSEVFDVTVAPGYHACVRSGKGWGFARRRGLYRTIKAAKDACETNWKLWNKFLSIEGRDKVTQVRDLISRSVVGKGQQAHSGMSDLPVWVGRKSSPRLLEVLRGGKCESSDDHTQIWKSSDSTDPSAEITNDPASDATVPEATSPETDGSERAKPAKGRAKARKKKSPKRTTKKSKHGKKKSKRSTKKSKR